ncbi:MAG: preprotein translocase subunit YajC [Ignavibacteriae bacterium HGW-Ignavibacteriae-1]|nr:MAG: preprotein translocase subunit YajC [Ignavibacteriae bacterium HGW-Ignavibacteriae-1]
MTPPGGGDAGGGGMMSMLLMFAVVIAIMYFMMIRPQQKRQKEHQNMLSNIRKGDRVVTTAGMHGTVTDSDDTTFTLQIADNVKVKFEKASIANKL